MDNLRGRIDNNLKEEPIQMGTIKIKQRLWILLCRCTNTNLYKSTTVPKLGVLDKLPFKQ